MAAKAAKPRRVRRLTEGERAEPEVEHYAIDPDAPAHVVGRGAETGFTMVRVAKAYTSIADDLAAESHKTTTAVLHDLIRIGLVATGVLLPAERLVARRLLTADGSVVTLRRLPSGQRVVDEPPADGRKK